MSDDELEKMHRQNFTAKLNYYLQLNHKRQSNIVADLGINKSTVSTWCRGEKMPHIATIQKLANYFDVTIAEFLNNPENKDLEIMSLIKQLPENKKELAIDYLKYLVMSN